MFDDIIDLKKGSSSKQTSKERKPKCRINLFKNIRSAAGYFCQQALKGEMIFYMEDYHV